MRRKRILVDLDNVVYPFAEKCFDWLDINKAMSFTPEIAMKAYDKWELWDCIGMSKGEFMRWWRLGVESGYIYAAGAPIRGSREALWALSDKEWSIDICTHRLNQFGLHDKTVSLTVEWLRRENIPYRNLYFSDEKPLIHADAIVDDVLRNMDPRVHGRCFLFPANHHGKLVTNSEREKSWKDIVEQLIG